MNHADGEKVAYLLKKAGYRAVREAEAGLIIVLACSVRQKPIDRIWGKLKIWKKINPGAKLILSGCLTEQDRKKFKSRFDYIFKIDHLFKLAKKLGVKDTKEDYLEEESEHQEKDRAFVPIMTGCNNFCSYCVVPYTRGRERSRPQDKILEEVRRLVKRDFKKIILLGQNVNSYHSDQTGFVQLLKAINRIAGDFKIEFLTSHPKDMGEDLIEAIASLPKMSHWVHLPVQSGDDQILKKMNRKYTARGYLKLVKKLRTEVKDLILTTDIIVGFPGEGREEFKNTVKLAKKAQFDKAYIAQYSPRPGTVAEGFGDTVSSQEKKKRWQFLNQMINRGNLKK